MPTKKKKKIDFKKKQDTWVSTVYKTIALCGYLPYSMLKYVGEEGSVRRALRSLSEAGYTVSANCEGRYVRLSTYGYNELKETFPDLYEHYSMLTMGNKSRGAKEKSKIIRMLDQGENICILNNLDGMRLLGSEKPSLQSANAKPSISSDALIYYTSKELKQADALQTSKFNFTRTMGLLVSPAEPFMIYNLNKSLIKWSNYGENKMIFFVNRLMEKNCQQPKKIQSAIMFSNELTVALKALDYNKANAYSYELFSIDNTYRNIHFITLDLTGYIQLQILTSNEMREHVMHNLYDESYTKPAASSVDCDRIKGDEIWLTMIDGNFSRLKRLKQSMIYFKNRKYRVICLDSQRDVISTYLDGTECEVTCISLENLTGMMEGLD